MAASTPFEDSYAKCFQDIEDKVGQSADSAEFMLDFWERLVRIEKEYARNLEDLYQSRYAQLTKMFQNTSVEPIPQVNEAWKAVVADVAKQAARRREVAEGVHKNVCAPLFRFIETEVPKQNNNIVLGKKVLKELKQERQKLTSDEKRFHKTCKDHAARQASVSAEDLTRLEASKAAERNAYRNSVDNFNLLCSQSFTSVLPGIVKDIRDAEVRRVEIVRTTIQQFTAIESASAAKVAFVETTAALEHMQPEAADHMFIKGDTQPASMVEFVEPYFEPAAPAAAAVAAPAPVQQAPPPKPQESGGFFSSWFSSSSKPEKKEPGQPPATAPTPIIRSASELLDSPDASIKTLHGSHGGPDAIVPDDPSSAATQRSSSAATESVTPLPVEESAKSESAQEVTLQPESAPIVSEGGEGDKPAEAEKPVGAGEHKEDEDETF